MLVCRIACEYNKKREKEKTMHTPQPNEIYRHFKGNHYRVLTLAKHSETGEMLVIYQALYDDHGVYARPLDMFTSEVDHEKYPDVTQKMRFELVPGVDLAVSSLISSDTDRRTASNNAADHITGSEAPACQPSDSTGITEGNGSSSEPVQTDNPTAAVVTSSRPISVKSADDLMEEFFDAETYRDRMNVLAAMHCMLTDSMVDTMAASLDTEIKNGNIDDRYYELKNYLATMEKYECNRLR